MKKILFLLIFLIVPANAELVTVSAKHQHMGNYSPIDSCNIAIEKAKKETIKQSSFGGLKITDNIVRKCSEIDGEYDCERNQLSLLELKGEIISWSEDKNKRNEGKDIVSGAHFCEVFITADVEPIKQNSDPEFHFNVKLNQEIYRSGEILEINIDANKKMYMSIFQWLPYGGKKQSKVTKIFPNKQYNKNVNNLIKDNINLKYEVYFPEEIGKKKVFEYLVFVASEKQLSWLPEYTEIEGLLSQLNKETEILMEKDTASYIIIK